MSFTARCDTSGLQAYLDHIGVKAEEAVRPAAQAGAQVLYQAVQNNVLAIGMKTGNLYRSIYQAYSRDHSQEGVVATYHVSWRVGRIKDANGKKVAGSNAPHGHLVEFGYMRRYKVYMKNGVWYTRKDKPLEHPVQVPAHPFVRPAAALFPVAEEAAAEQLRARVL